jgi:hypothetical protein
MPATHPALQDAKYLSLFQPRQGGNERAVKVNSISPCQDMGINTRRACLTQLRKDRVIQRITHQKPASRPVMTGRSGSKSVSAVSGIASVMARFFYRPLTSDMPQPLTGHERVYRDR